MKIAFAGASGSGKTTLRNELFKLDQFKNYTTFESIQRTLITAVPGFETSENTDTFSQTCINGVTAYLITTNSDFIMDRSVIDNLVYSKMAEKISNNDQKMLEERFSHLIKEYDVIIYVPYGEFKFVNDDIRSNDHEYHALTDKLIQDYLRKYSPRNVIRVSGTVEERLNMILEGLKRIRDIEN